MLENNHERSICYRESNILHPFEPENTRVRHIKKIKYIIIVMKPSIDLDSRGISEMKRNHHRSYGRSRTRHPSHSNESRRINTVQVMRGQLFVDNIIYMCTNAH